MIEVGSGFHPELTGRENIFLSGAILGLRRREIAARLDSIADFSGVVRFLDTPVKYYSSGMYVRLGFAIAAHLEPDILLIDEVLAVGDVEFQARCLQRIQELKRRGTTMMLVSHDLGAIEQLSDRAILFDGGRLVDAGRPHDVITAYQRLVSGPDALSPDAATDDMGNDPLVRVTALTLEDTAGATMLTATTGAPLIARVRLVFHTTTAATIRLTFFNFDTGALLTELTGEADPAGRTGPGGELDLLFAMPELMLAPGAYTLGLTATLRDDERPIAWRFGRTTLYVQGASRAPGVFAQPFQCRVAFPESIEPGAARRA
jgi:lipopolysaccharide transport system ATP-binding protein